MVKSKVQRDRNTPGGFIEELAAFSAERQLPSNGRWNDSRKTTADHNSHTIHTASFCAQHFVA